MAGFEAVSIRMTKRQRIDEGSALKGEAFEVA